MKTETLEKQGVISEKCNTHFPKRSLSLDEQGMLDTLMELSDNRNFSIAGLAAILTDGRDKIAKTLNKLAEKGYFRRIRVIDKKGKIVEWKYEFSYDVHPDWIENNNPTQKVVGHNR